MIILQDSKEQEPLEFNHVAIDWVQICALPFGDYWCVLKDNHIVPIVFERKALGDFFSSFGGRYKAEKAKLRKAHRANVLYKVIIEEPLTEVLKGPDYGKVSGLGLARTMFTWMERYEVETIFCKNRKEMATYIAERFYAYGKEYTENKKRDAQNMAGKER